MTSVTLKNGSEYKTLFLQTISFLLVGSVLSIVQMKVALKMLIFERFYPGSGWLEILLLASYAFFITGKMLNANESAKWRSRIWQLFSFVFFSQLLLGLLGLDVFLMTGKLHLPVPALIMAGPIYRGDSFFMPILFLSTIVLVGPAWCSHLCYIGAWDDWAAHQQKIPQKNIKQSKYLRFGILIAVIITAFVLRAFQIPTIVAVFIAAAFGMLGVLLMLFWSRKSGIMNHCVTYCPMGLIANIIGKVNPFRIRIGNGCITCMDCSKVCRYNALNLENIKNHKPSLTCTLCGDCISSCNQSQLSYGFLGIKSFNSRKLFIVLIVSMHAVFMGLARL